MGGVLGPTRDSFGLSDYTGVRGMAADRREAEAGVGRDRTAHRGRRRSRRMESEGRRQKAKKSGWVVTSKQEPDGGYGRDWSFGGAKTC